MSALRENKVVLLLSGGMDSTVLLHRLLADKNKVVCLFVDYGQAHALREFASAKAAASRAGVQLHRWCTAQLGSCDGASPVVPGRNAVLLSLAANLAAQHGIGYVAIGCTKDDSVLFPDCRYATFMDTMSRALTAGYEVKVEMPWCFHTKAEVAREGRELGVVMDETYSCYRGGEPCGECLACKTRTAALGAA